MRRYIEKYDIFNKTDGIHLNNRNPCYVKGSSDISKVLC